MAGLHCLSLCIFSLMSMVPLAAGNTMIVGRDVLNITYSPSEIIAGLTKDATISCRRLPGTIELQGLTIQRKDTKGRWRLVAYVYKEDLQVFDQRINADGEIKTKDGSGYITVTWPLATTAMFGSYRCSGNFYTSTRKARLVYTVTLKINGLSDVSTWNKFWKNVENQCSDSTAVSEFGTQLKFYRREIKDNREMLWRRGKYALLKPDTGCPASYMRTRKSHLTFHEESKDSGSSMGKPCLLRETDNHLSTPLSDRLNKNCFVTLRFCEVHEDLLEVPWPEGKFCVNKLVSQNCTAGFSASSLNLTYENSTVHKTDISGDTVQDMGGVNTISFCCKTGGSHNTPISLPRAQPFYLYRYGGACQTVHGMRFTEEFIDLNTEDTNNHDKIKGQMHPDVDITSGSPVRLYLCYYKYVDPRTRPKQN